VYARARASYDIIKKEPKLNSLIPDPNPATFPKKIRGGGECVWGGGKKNEKSVGLVIKKTKPQIT